MEGSLTLILSCYPDFNKQDLLLCLCSRPGFLSDPQGVDRIRGKESIKGWESVSTVQYTRPGSSNKQPTPNKEATSQPQLYHIRDGIANPIYGCGVKMAPDINPIYAGLEKYSKNVLYVDVGLV